MVNHTINSITGQASRNSFHNSSVMEAMPPTLYAIEAEEAVLGQILLDPEVLKKKCFEKLTIQAFHFWQHQEIYRAMIDLHQKGDPADLMNVARYLGAKLEQIGGQTKLALLVDRTDYHEARYLPQRIELILEAYKKRQLWQEQQRFANAAADRFSNADELAVELKERIAKISSGENLLPVHDRIVKIFQKNLRPSHQKQEFKKLADEFYWNLPDILKLADAIEAELLADEEKPESSEKLRSLIANQSKKLNISHYLYGDGGELATAIEETAKAMPTAAEYIFTTLLSVAASRIGTSSRIIINARGKYTQTCIFWTAIVARSGRMKTPAQKIVTDPLTKLEIEAKKHYEREMLAWEAAGGDKAEKPTRYRYMTTDITTETLDRIHGENPRGLLYYRDELAGMLKARNQYKKGAGSDEESEISQFNGGALISDRKERSTCLEKTAVSRTGSIQWDTAQGLLNQATDGNGGICRWLFCAADAPARFLDLMSNDADTGISELLESFYERLGRLPEADYLIAKDAKAIFQEWQHELVRREISEKRPGFSLVYPKIETYTARLALWLHCANAALAGKNPEPIVSTQTMVKAISLAKWFLDQAELVYGMNSDESLTGNLLKLYEHAKGKAKLTIREIQAGIKAFRKSKTSNGLTAAQVRELCQQLANEGYATFENNVLTVADHADHLLTNRSAPKTQPEKELQKFADFADQIKTPSSPDLVNTENLSEKVNTVSTVSKQAETLSPSAADQGASDGQQRSARSAAVKQPLSTEFQRGDRVLVVKNDEWEGQKGTVADVKKCSVLKKIEYAVIRMDRGGDRKYEPKALTLLSGENNYSHQQPDLFAELQPGDYLEAADD